jgi:hypothetical protein
MRSGLSAGGNFPGNGQIFGRWRIELPRAAGNRASPQNRNNFTFDHLAAEE